jgi:hypothetical protein
LVEKTKPLPAKGPIQGSPDKQKYYQNPSVRSVLEAFSGEIIDIRE